MKRSDFMKSMAIGLGMFSTSLVGNASALGGGHEKRSQNMKPKILKEGEGEKQLLLGDRQTIKLTGKDTNNQYTQIEHVSNPGMGIPLHIHRDEDEVFHVLEGELEIQVGDEVKVLKSGDIGFCPRGIPHSWRVVGDQKVKLMLCVFPSGIEHMFKEIAALPAGPPDLEVLRQISEKYNIRFV
ncbi:MAG: cupin domain-containing protein [Bacteroidota bacterium]